MVALAAKTSERLVRSKPLTRKCRAMILPWRLSWWMPMLLPNSVGAATISTAPRDQDERHGLDNTTNRHAATTDSKEKPLKRDVLLQEYAFGDDYDPSLPPENPLRFARSLVPPEATTTEGGEAEGAEWWLEHEGILRDAWKQWDGEHTNELPVLEESLVVHPSLVHLMQTMRNFPTLEHEYPIRRAWTEVLWKTDSPLTESKEEDSLPKSPFDLASPLQERNDGRHHQHRVYRCPEFLSIDGIRRLRHHLDALSGSGIPRRRPNAMNRNGLLLAPEIPGGIVGDAMLHEFVTLLAQEYLQPLGRSLFPEFAGNPNDDAHHYAFTIRYGSSDDEKDYEEHDAKHESATGTNIGNATTHASSSAAADFDLQEHSDASLYTLNINLNLPEEDYSGSALYFKQPKEGSDVAHGRMRNGTSRNDYREVAFAPGTAVLHRGATRHGAQPLAQGSRHNLVVWLFGDEGYVRIAPYPNSERMTRREKWTNEQPEREPVPSSAAASHSLFGGLSSSSDSHAEL